MAKITFDEREGYRFLSDSGISYALLEGVCMGGGISNRMTSDIYFIMLDDPDYNVDNNVVGWSFGASALDENNENCLEYIIAEVNEFEERNHIARKPECLSDGGGLYTSYVPLSDGRILIVESEWKTGFSIYCEDEHDRYHYGDSNLITTGEAIYIDLMSEEVKEAYYLAVKMINEMY